MKLLRRLLHCSQGATAIEYAMIAAMISVIAILAFIGVANSLENNYYTLVQTIPR